jgi:LysR family transcriptional regulator, low CO2-responsive transcriptional regulator
MDEPNFHQLRLFLEVARRGSFSRAAEALAISQPAVSAQVALLERRYGQPLLERLPRGLRLTEAGGVLKEYAERIFGLAEEMEVALDDLRGLRRGHLTVGASSTIGEYVLPPLIGRFKALHPDVAVAMRVANTERILAEVRGRQLDLAFVGGRPTGDDLLAEPFDRDEIVPLAAPDHPLAGRAEVTLGELAAAGLVAREAGSATRATAEASLRGAGLEPQLAMELGSNEAVKRAVRAGLGVGLLSRRAADSELAAGHLIVLDVPAWSCRRELYAIHRREKRLTAAERRFLDLTRASAAP